MVPFLFRQWISKLKVSTGGNSSSYRPGRKSVATHRLISAAPSFRPARLYLEPLEDRTVPNAALLDPNPQETDFLIPSSSTPIADPLATPTHPTSPIPSPETTTGNSDLTGQLDNNLNSNNFDIFGFYYDDDHDIITITDSLSWIPNWWIDITIQYQNLWISSYNHNSADVVSTDNTYDPSAENTPDIVTGAATAIHTDPWVGWLHSWINNSNSDLFTSIIYTVINSDIDNIDDANVYDPIDGNEYDLTEDVIDPDDSGTSRSSGQSLTVPAVGRSSEGNAFIVSPSDPQLGSVLTLPRLAVVWNDGNGQLWAQAWSLVPTGDSLALGLSTRLLAGPNVNYVEAGAVPAALAALTGFDGWVQDPSGLSLMVMTLGSDGQPTGVAASLWLRPDADGNLPTVPEGWQTVLQLAQKRAFYETYPQLIAPSTSYSQPSTGLHLGVSRESGWLLYYGAAVIEGLADGVDHLFVQPVVRTGQAVIDGGGLILVDGYQPLNPHIAGMLQGERTWYGGTFNLLMDGVVVIPVLQSGRRVIGVGQTVVYEWASARAYNAVAPQVAELQATAAALRAEWARHSLEVQAQWRLVQLNGQVPGAHFLARHSPDVPLEALKNRAMHGIDPWTGKVVMYSGRPAMVDSTRFTSYEAMEEAIAKAQQVFRAEYPSGVAPNKVRIRLDMCRPVGEGFAQGTGEYRSGLSRVIVVLNRYGLPETVFPLFGAR